MTAQTAASAEGAGSAEKTAGPATAAPVEKTDQSTPGLELVGVSKTLGNNLVVNDVSMKVHKGEMFTLLGSSGSGKTTTLNLIAGFLEPDEGEIFIRGRNVASIPPEKRGLGIVFQTYALFPHMSVAQNVAFPLRQRGIRGAELRRRVKDALTMVELENRGGAKPGELSGGQKQRVALARGLVFEPEMMLFDEPLGALDRKLRQQLQEELREIHDRIKFTALYVTHDQEEALALSDEVAVMTRGIIAQSATNTEIYDRPANAFVAQFLGDANLLSVTVQDVANSGCVVKTNTGSVTSASFGAGVSLGTGEAGLLVARPEALEVVARENGEDCLVAGTLSYKRFVGQDILAAVDDGTGGLIQVRERPGGELESLEIDSKVCVRWRDSDKACVIGVPESEDTMM